ncbi:MAG: hydroxyisourate hydrolase [Gammaproteobacteria bacterium]|nr:hydroxyisourate hydrolase [Gammaproteobacteria bacterium]NNM00110.1 hydroxyisourate hydrolase [Gammaproteobacteria bacterium]
MSRLTTHVLDTMHGRPGAGLRVALYRLSGEARTLLLETTTSADGRTAAPLLEGGDFSTGEYELVFDVGAYFRALGVEPAQPPFLGTVPIRFGIADAGAHYHVPLLVSPWSYSTYRGS